MGQTAAESLLRCPGRDGRVQGRAREPRDRSQCLSAGAVGPRFAGGVALVPPLCIVELCAGKMWLNLRTGCPVLCQSEILRGERPALGRVTQRGFPGRAA